MCKAKEKILYYTLICFNIARFYCSFYISNSVDLFPLYFLFNCSQHCSILFLLTPHPLLYTMHIFLFYCLFFTDRSCTWGVVHTKFISLVLVVHDPKKRNSRELWPNKPFISFVLSTFSYSIVPFTFSYSIVPFTFPIIPFTFPILSFLHIFLFYCSLHIFLFYCSLHISYSIVPYVYNGSSLDC